MDQVADEDPLPQRAEQVHVDTTAIRSKVAELEQHAQAFIKQQPIVAILAAAGVGYLVARIVTRGMR
jgi:hypothetical protein